MQFGAYTFVETRRDPATGEPIDVDKAFADVIEQIERVSAALLGTPQLRKVASDTNLLAGAVTLKEQQAVIDDLRQRITIIADVDPTDPNPHAAPKQDRKSHV